MNEKKIAAPTDVVTLNMKDLLPTVITRFCHFLSLSTHKVEWRNVGTWRKQEIPISIDIESEEGERVWKGQCYFCLRR